jgi:hypothetical protein
MNKKEGAQTITHRVTMGCGNIYYRIVLNHAGVPKSIFINIGKPGQCQAAQSQAVALAISVGLKNGVEFKHYIKALKGIGCNEAQPGEPDKRCSSCYDALAKILATYPREEKADGVA